MLVLLYPRAFLADSTLSVWEVGGNRGNRVIWEVSGNTGKRVIHRVGRGGNVAFRE